jgi:dTDP-4-amino-4,6-dideoxygalactose transaminase
VKRVEFGECKISENMKKAVNECLDSNWLTIGPRVKEFEEKFAKRFGHKYAVMVNSGTSADMAILMTLEPGEIILPALGFIAAANAVRAASHTPVFVDIERETLNIDPTRIEREINQRTRAIMVINTMGRPCELDPILDLCEKYNLKLIIDGCESHLCEYKGKGMGSYGDTTYSFFTAHCLFGVEGGAIGTDSEETYNKLRSIRSHGREPESLYFDHQRYGLNFKPTDLNASIALCSLDELDETFQKRREIQKKMWQFPLRDLVWYSEEQEGNLNCPHGFSLTVKNPDHFPILVRELDRANIHHKRNFGCIPTQHKAFEYMGYRLGMFPESEYVGNYGLHIGCHQFLTEEDIQQIFSAFEEFKKCVS